MPSSSSEARIVVQSVPRSSMMVSLPARQAPGTTPVNVSILRDETPGPGSVKEKKSRSPTGEIDAIKFTVGLGVKGPSSAPQALLGSLSRISTVQVAEQPSPPAKFPSSQPSPASAILLPHSLIRQALGSADVSQR